MRSTTRESIDQFLGARRIAVVGVSRDSKHFSRRLFADLRERGYDLVPVNPNASEIEGQRCYRSATEISPPVDAALLFTTGKATDGVVRDCDAAGIRKIWMYRATGAGAVTDSAVEYCDQHGITVIPGECPYMFLPQTGWFHRFHGLVRRVTGSYPA